jgi:hypothetical protein
MFAIGIDHYDHDIRILFHVPKRLVQLLSKRYGERVPGFGAIQGDHTDSAQFFGKDQFRLHSFLLWEFKGTVVPLFALFLDLYDIRNISGPGAATAAGLAAHLGIDKIRKEAGVIDQTPFAVEGVGQSGCRNIILGGGLRNDEPGIHPVPLAGKGPRSALWGRSSRDEIHGSLRSAGMV